MQGVDQSLADRERRRLEARRAKAVELTGACHDCHAQLIGLGCRRRRRERWGRRTGRGLRSERRNIRSIGLFPQASPHADHDAGCRRCVGPHKDLGPHRSSSFHRCPRRPDATPARSTVRRHRRSAREKMAKEIKAEMTVNVPAVPLIIHWDGKLVEGMAGEGIAERFAHPGVRLTASRSC
ncbi:hypothetical protein GWK47_047432 [Chionoecetes opilio]|uniref:Uncharacterized protein n=1 Tax=Chionoecetes opilio TaxID=41210 RepID=A0A8J4Y5G0_CHIOP|nr:hypothetical protein GWK47_047432 [Chionoecetes opilio]